jgi:hypothetical protein
MKVYQTEERSTFYFEITGLISSKYDTERRGKLIVVWFGFVRDVM